MLKNSLLLLPFVLLAANATLAAPRPVKDLSAFILTPTPGPKPKINGPKVFGVRPGNPIVFTVAATGQRPMTFSASDLPRGVHLDAQTGQLSGSVPMWGTYPVTLRATNALGTATRVLKIVVGERIALTPPMGWNSYHLYDTKITQPLILAQAKAMVSSGLVNHGWSYINIDDGWQGKRGGEFGGIMPDSWRFKDMPALSGEIHEMGLKLGIYSTPWVESYANRIGGTAMNPYGDFAPTEKRVSVNTNRLPFAVGSYDFLLNDTRQFAAWGVDYLKYDWYPVRLPETIAMSQALRSSGRDIVFSVSNNADIEDGRDLSQWTNAWRTERDIKDEWGSIKWRLLHQDKWAPYAGPGHWNDPDMMLLGTILWKRGVKKPTRLTPDEQYTHMSAWSLMAAPLLLGCDLNQLDAFTISLLSNDEVIGVNQDPLGKQGRLVAQTEKSLVMAKPLEDGSQAVGLFNIGDKGPQTIALQWGDLKIKGPHIVRDLWRQKDMGTYEGRFSAAVNEHGVLMLSVRPAQP